MFSYHLGPVGHVSEASVWVFVWVGTGVRPLWPLTLALHVNSMTSLEGVSSWMRSVLFVAKAKDFFFNHLLLLIF